MSEWRDPITDRTYDDVTHIDQTSLNHQKGALNADDLNRIEDNFRYVMEKLKSDAILIPHRLRNYAETKIVEVEKTVEIKQYYHVLEYLQSGGTQYIDTGFVPNQDTAVEATAMALDLNSFGDGQGFCLCGADQNYDSRAYNMYIDKSKMSINYGNAYYYFGDAYANVKFHYSQNKNQSAFSFDNGISYTGTQTYVTFTAPSGLLLFALKRANSTILRGVSRIYTFKLYDNGTLIRDYVPVRRETDGAVGLYDKVSQTLYENVGTGDFITGAETGEQIAIPNDNPEYEYIVVREEVKTVYTDWQEHNLPWLSEINRIRANHNALVRLFLVELGLPLYDENNYLLYSEVNDWERIALKGKEMFENMEKEYRYCGMEESGGDRLL